MGRSTGILLVVAQFGCAAILVFTARFLPLCIGCLLLLAVGAALAIWAWLTIGLRRLSLVPALQENAHLVTAGPYRWIRHPMYSGLLIFSAGLLLTEFSLLRAAVLLLLLLVLLAKIWIEERQLLARFPEYLEYRSRTWRLFPPLF